MFHRRYLTLFWIRLLLSVRNRSNRINLYPSIKIWLESLPSTLDKGLKLNIHKKIRRHSKRLLNVLCTFIVRFLSRCRTQKLIQWPQQRKNNSKCFGTVYPSNTAICRYPSTPNQFRSICFDCFWVACLCFFCHQTGACLGFYQSSVMKFFREKALLKHYQINKIIEAK